MKRLNHFLLLLLVLVACRKEEPEPENSYTDPVFGVELSVDGIPTNMTAGDGSFYMFTDYESDSAGVYRFSGDLRQKCAGCSTSFRIILLDHKASNSGEPVNPDSSFGVKAYPYLLKGVNIPRSYIVNFTSRPVGSGVANHFWDFGDGTTSTLANPVRAFQPGRKYPVSYTVSYPGGCSSNLSYALGFRKYIIEPRLDFTYAPLDSTRMRFTVTGDTAGPALFHWTFDNDTSTDTGPTVFHKFPPGSFGKVYVVKVLNNDTLSEAGRNVVNGPYPNCVADYSLTQAIQNDPLNRSTVIIAYTDAAGITYYSSNIRQPEGSYLNVLGSDSYVNDEKGRKTRSLSVTGSCLLSNGGRTIRLENIKGLIAVAHP